MKGANTMKNNLSEKAFKIIRIIRIVVTIIITCEVIRRFATGQSASHLILVLLLLMAPFKIYNNHVVTRKQFESTGRSDEYKKIVLKSIIRAIIIVTIMVVGTVIYSVYF